MSKTLARKQRAAALKALGFHSLDAYIRSDLWSVVKEDVVDGAKCIACGDPATDATIVNFTAAVLSGKDRSGIIAVCDRQHVGNLHKLTHRQLSSAARRLVSKGFLRAAFAPLQSRR